MTQTDSNREVPTTATKEYITGYRGTLLTDEQATSLLPALKDLVRSTDPIDPDDARQILSAACRFLADVAPPTGGDLASMLTESNVTRWVARVAASGGSSRTMTNHVGRIRRLIRVLNGLPARSRCDAPPTARPPELTEAESDDLLIHAEAAGRPAQRGVLASVGAGLVGAPAVGAVVSNGGGFWQLSLPTGKQYRLLPCFDELAELLNGETIMDGDWSEARRAATLASVWFDGTRARQTFLVRAVGEPDPLAALVWRYRLTVDAFDALRVALRRSEAVDAEVFEFLLRGDGRAISPPVGTGRGTPPKGRGIEKESDVSIRRGSKAEARRIAKAAREHSENPAPLPVVLEASLRGYSPESVSPQEWSMVAEVHAAVMRRSGLKSEASFVKHRKVLAGFLLWAHRGGAVVSVADSMSFAVIDRYYMVGMDGLSERTRNDYRSRLRTLAMAANPGPLAPPRVPTAGHQRVRPGYDAIEEAGIIRVSKRQSSRVMRRQLCIIVGSAGGAGLDSIDMRELRAEHFVLTGADEPIVIHVPGPRARITVVRREYEEIVRMGLEGLRPNDLVLGRSGQSQNVTAGIVEDAKFLDSHVPRPDVSRLRATWLMWLMQRPVPLKVIFDASGLVSARSLTDLLSYLPAETVVDSITALREGVAS